MAVASRLGLTVHAVGASPTWTDRDLRYLGPKLVRLVGQYNATAPPARRLKGVQLDIEPYVNPGFFDERVNVILLERILEQDGYPNVRSTTKSDEAVALYDEFEPDLILLDLHMPGLDGFAVMERLRDRTLATVQVPFKKGQWGKMRRQGATAVATPAESPAVTAPRP